MQTSPNKTATAERHTPDTCADTDALLMTQVAQGAEHALRMLVEKWKNPLANYFYRSVRNAHTAEGLTQQTFINLYKARAHYTPSAKFSTYIFHIARRVLIGEFRNSACRPSQPTDPADITGPAEISGEREAAELEEIFYTTLQTLPENQRTAILLYKQQELSYEEIAVFLELTLVTVKRRISRGRNQS